jgi:hypothetical protein
VCTRTGNTPDLLGNVVFLLSNTWLASSKLAHCKDFCVLSREGRLLSGGPLLLTL